MVLNFDGELAVDRSTGSNCCTAEEKNPVDQSQKVRLFFATLHSFSSWTVNNVSKIVINFNSGTSIPTTVNFAPYKTSQLFTS